MIEACNGLENLIFAKSCEYIYRLEHYNWKHIYRFAAVVKVVNGILNHEVSQVYNYFDLM